MIAGPQKHTNWSLVVSRFQGIEQLKKEERRWAKKTKWMNMRAVFGHPFSILWFSPFSTPDHGKAETYQYVVWRLSAGSEAVRSKPKWEGLPPPYTHTAQRDLHCISHISNGQLFMCFFLCCQLSALYVLFLCCLEWVELQRKRNTLQSCLQTLWWICLFLTCFLSPLSEAPLSSYCFLFASP